MILLSAKYPVVVRRSGGFAAIFGVLVDISLFCLKAYLRVSLFSNKRIRHRFSMLTIVPFIMPLIGNSPTYRFLALCDFSGAVCTDQSGPLLTWAIPCTTPQNSSGSKAVLFWLPSSWRRPSVNCWMVFSVYPSGLGGLIATLLISAHLEPTFSVSRVEVCKL